MSNAEMPTDIPPLDVDIDALERQRFAKPTHKKAAAAVTPEDLAIDMQLEAMLKENELPEISDNVAVKPVVQERKQDCLLGDLVEDITLATTLNELEHQCALAKQLGADAIEAAEKVVRYFTRGSFEDVKTAGYFMYKDIKVFLPERFSETPKTDKMNMFWTLHGEPKK